MSLILIEHIYWSGPLWQVILAWAFIILWAIIVVEKIGTT